MSISVNAVGPSSPIVQWMLNVEPSALFCTSAVSRIHSRSMGFCTQAPRGEFREGGIVPLHAL